MESVSQPFYSEGGSSRFQPSQIICLEHGATRLYAEVVQIVEARHLCWARTLVLVTGSEDSQQPINPKNLYDLRQGADLLLPTVLFRQALDTEVIPLLSQLYGLAGEAKEQDAVAVRQSIHQLIRQICQTHPDAFSSQ
jgi:hypothetical protein